MSLPRVERSVFVQEMLGVNNNMVGVTAMLETNGTVVVLKREETSFNWERKKPGLQPRCQEKEENYKKKGNKIASHVTRHRVRRIVVLFLSVVLIVSVESNMW